MWLISASLYDRSLNSSVICVCILLLVCARYRAGVYSQPQARCISARLRCIGCYQIAGAAVSFVGWSIDGSRMCIHIRLFRLFILPVA
ncbi:hypothetical protein DFH11DRAFT_1627482 [Phellopilus nigrolimitatus]|nr:hypothetical protein DFH11DRAFT_1627482 [Phellopilus nigrolimitatus]